MQFVFQPLTWGFLLVLVPLIAHLINLLRHRRTKWAAMEFLIESYRKHRRWVWMKQLLLLLSRMVIMAVLTAMLAQWITGAKWLSILGQTVTHHYVLLDDSLSMADSVQGLSAYQAGLRAVASLLAGVAGDQSGQQVTILRYSRARSDLSPEATKKDSVDGKAVSIDSVADILARSIPADPAPLLEGLNRTLPVGLSVSPIAAIETITPLIRSASNEQALVYFVGDFRERDWRQSQAVRSALEPLKSKAEIHLIDCAPTAHENLTITTLEPDQEVLAAGVPVMMRMDVSNPGSSPARNVSISLKTFENTAYNAEPRIDHFASGKEISLPPMVIDLIAPGETVSRRFQVIFSQAGSQVVQAVLPDDALNEDNSFAAALDVVEGRSLLLIDGSDSRRAAFYLNATLNPGGMTRTGWRSQTEGPSFLRDTSPEILKDFAAVLLMNVVSLDSRALTNLESYVGEGGGLAMMLGGDVSQADIERMNRDWHRRGQGLLPYPIKSIAELPTTTASGDSPDMTPTPHPIFGPLLGSSNSPFQWVRIFRYLQFDVALPKAFDQEEMSTAAQVIVKLRDGSPLMIDHPFGKGRVVIFGTAIDPSWTTWPQDPTFVVGMLKTVGYLASFRVADTSLPIGEPIELRFSSREQLPEAEIILPAIGRNTLRQTVTLNAQPDTEPMLKLRVAADPAVRSEPEIQAMLSTGITEIWKTNLSGERRVECFARNAPPQEGELKKLAVSELLGGLRPIEAKYRVAESVAATTALAGLSNRQGFLLILLIALLMFEQFLAWSASYHLPTVSAKGAA
jgi:uncharacterized membrane protein